MTEPPGKKQKFQSKKKYFQPKRKQYLEVGHRGFLATCNFNEKDCIRECYKILNQHADELYGVENAANNSLRGENDEPLPKNTEDAANDISDELQMEINATQFNSNIKRRFQVVDTGASNCLFIKTTLDDPQAVVKSIVNDISNTKQKTRHLLRLLPIEIVCKANAKDIIDAAGQLCDRFFLKDHTTFSIVFNKRFNNDMNRDHLIHEIANLIHAKNAKNKVDLKHAERSLIIEVIKGLCCLTVVDGYMSKKKYNLVELAKAKDDNNAAKQNDENNENTKTSESTEGETK